MQFFFLVVHVHMKLANMFHCAEPEAIEEYSHFVFTSERDKDCLSRRLAQIRGIVPGC